MDFLRYATIVHRGVYDNNLGIPENTIPAFEIAISKKHAIELDIHIIKDNTIVVFHDNTLKRAANIDKNIKDYTYEELSKIQIFESLFKIPKLEEVLELVNSKVGLLIELKYDNEIGRLEEQLINILDKYSGEFAIQSFNPFMIYNIKRKRSNWIRGQLLTGTESENRFKEILLKIGIYNPFTNPDFISCQLPLLKNKIIQKSRKEKLVLGWTAKNKEQIEEYKKYCDNLIIDKFK